MRTITPIALLALCLVVLLNIDASMKGRGEGESDELDIFVFSTGHGLAHPQYVPRQKGLDCAIIAGERVLRLKDVPPGLRLATFGPGLLFKSHRNFDLTGSREDAEALIEHCEKQGVGTVMILSVSGGVGVEETLDPEGRNSLARTMISLDAQALPIDAAGASWALICLRRREGWIALAEAYSERSGVMLAFTMEANRAMYDGYEGDRTIDRRPGQVHHRRAGGTP